MPKPNQQRLLSPLTLDAADYAMQRYFENFLQERDSDTYQLPPCASTLTSVRIGLPGVPPEDLPKFFTTSVDLIDRHILPLLTDKEQRRLNAKLTYDYVTTPGNTFLLPDILNMSARHRCIRIREAIEYIRQNPTSTGDYANLNILDPSPEDDAVFNSLGQDDIDIGS